MYIFRYEVYFGVLKDLNNACSLTMAAFNCGTDLFTFRLLLLY